MNILSGRLLKDNIQGPFSEIFEILSIHAQAQVKLKDKTTVRAERLRDEVCNTKKYQQESWSL